MLRRVLLLAFFIAQLVAIYAFVRGFLLTRIHLPKTEYKSFDGNFCDSPYRKLVWIVVDALRCACWFFQLPQRQRRILLPDEQICDGQHWIG